MRHAAAVIGGRYGHGCGYAYGGGGGYSYGYGYTATDCSYSGHDGCYGRG